MTESIDMIKEKSQETIENLPLDKVATAPNLYPRKREKYKYLVNDFKNIKSWEKGKTFDLINNSDEEVESIKNNKFLGKQLYHISRPKISYYSKNQKWIGNVTKLNDEGFSAQLKDITSGGTNEYGDFFYDEVTKEDKHLISLGSTFYMSIGLVSVNGTTRKESEIRFQRLADFDHEDVINQGLDLTSDFIKYFK